MKTNKPMDFTNPILSQIWKDRYCKNNETLDDNLKRVANYCSTTNQEQTEFYNIMKEGLFFPAGRTMSNSGIGKTLTLNNCFLNPVIHDNIDSIFNCVKYGAITHKAGGGIGYDFSLIRPNGTPTSNEAIASGVVSFMKVFDTQTETIMQGSRRGANMGVLNIYHPDIEEFIDAKSYDRGLLTHFNMSVMVDDDFVYAVKEDKEIYLHFPVYDDKYRIIKDESSWTIKRKIKAKDLWNKIVKKAYDNGEPGILFYDNMNKDNNTYYIETITHTNPCGEFLGGTVFGEKLSSENYGGACNLGSIFLHNMVENPFTNKAKFNYDKFKKAIRVGVRFLDNIIDINNFPRKVYENYQKSFRTLGLGVTGLADMLAMLGLKYNTQQAQLFVYDLMNMFAFEAYKNSIELAKERGSFPFLKVNKFIKSGYLQKHLKIHPEWVHIINGIQEFGIRNARLISIAPTGTISLTYGNNCSSGIEPIFSLEYDRRVKIGGQTDDDIQIVTMKDFAYDLWQKTEKKDVDKDVFVTAMNMTVNDHIDMLSNIAFHVDMSVSKTINVPFDYSFEDTKNIYMRCWEQGIKGCTIFRPNKIRQGILITENNFDDKENKEQAKTKKINNELHRGDILQVNDDVIGKKRKLITGCGSLHCSAFFDPVTGDLVETYLSKGSSGGCNNFMIGLSRMISLSARSGCDIYSIIDQLNSCGVCPSYAVRKATKSDVSKGSCCPIAIGNALLDMYNEMQSEISDYDDFDERYNTTKSKQAKQTIEYKCPECGETIVFEGGCNICKSCGWSKCG